MILRAESEGTCDSLADSLVSDRHLAPRIWPELSCSSAKLVDKLREQITSILVLVKHDVVRLVLNAVLTIESYMDAEIMSLIRSVVN